MKKLLLLLTLLLSLCLYQGVVAEEKADHFLDYGRAVANLNDIVSKGTSEEDILASRLLLRSKKPMTNLESFSPLAVVSGPGNRYTVQFATEAQALACMSVLQKDANVRYVHQDALAYAYGDVSEESLTQKALAAAKAASPYMSWGAMAMGADDLAASIQNAGSVTVAVVDTGVTKHAFLNDRVKNGGADFIDPSNKNGRADGNGHGSHVAGTIVDLTQGLKVYILPVRVLNDGGSGANSGIANGILYAVESGAKVINMSLGGTGISTYPENIYTDAIEYANSKDVTVVVAAGNEDSDVRYCIPACVPNAITVAALDVNLKKASYSNYGDSIDVAAPGSNIVSCALNGGFTSMSGTSMASPHTAAIAAMIKLKYPGYSPARVADAMKDHCIDLGKTGWDGIYGYGMPCFIGGDFLFEGDYAYRLADGEAKIAAYLGLGGAITLPETIGGHKVVAVDLAAFADNKTVTDVTVPGGIQEVGEHAFENCAALKTVTVKEGVVKIGASAFRGCAALETVTLPENLRDIDSYAFFGCASLKSLQLPVRLQSMGEYALGETGLVTMTIPASLKTLPGSLFQNCADLERVTIEEGVLNIGSSAFRYCAKLTALALPKTVTAVPTYALRNSGVQVISMPGVTKLENGAFIDADQLIEVTLPDGVTTIPMMAFARCANLQKVVVPRSVTEVGRDAFADCPKLTLYVYTGSAANDYAEENKIPYESIGNQDVLTGLSVVQDVVYGEPDQYFLTFQYVNTEPAEFWINILSIEWTIENPEVVALDTRIIGGFLPVPAFHMLKEGETMVTGRTTDGSDLTVSFKLVCTRCIPREVRLDRTELRLAIGENRQLKATVLPDAAVQTVEWASDDEAVVQVDAEGRLIGIGTGVATITATSTGEAPVSATCRVTVVANTAQAADFTYIKMPDDTLAITGYQGSAKDIEIPAAIQGLPVTNIGAKAFYKSDISSVKIPEGVSYIEELAFAQCAKLKSVSLPDSLVLLSQDAFKDCTKLPKVKSLSLRVSATKIEECPFLICPVFTPSNTAAAWSMTTSPKNAATIMPEGLFLPLTDDYFRVIVKAGGKQAVVGFEGGQPYAASAVTISGKSKRSVKMGDTLSLTYKIEPASAQVVATWASENPEIATVDGQGVVTPVAPGKAKITLQTDKGLTDSVTVTVKAVTPKVRIDGKAKRTLKIGKTLALTYTRTPASEEDADTATWISDNPDVATVDESGVITGVAKGEAKITLKTASGLKDSVTITVR